MLRNLLIVGLTVLSLASSTPIQGQDVSQANTSIAFADSLERADAGAATAEYSLNLRGEALPGGGFKVASVDNSSPVAAGPAGESYQLEAGDVILTIDNRTIASAKDYHDAVSGCGRRQGVLRLTVRRFRTNRIQVWNVRPTRVRTVPQQTRTNNPNNNNNRNNTNNPNTNPNPNPNNQSAGRIRILIIADTNDPSIGRSIQVSKTRVRQTLLTAPGVTDQDIVEISGNQISNANILSAIQRLTVQSNDTLLVYSLTHGAYRPEQAAGDPAGGHFLAIPGTGLSRKTLLTQMKARNARLTVLITDCCNTNLYNPPTSGVAGEFQAAAGNNRVLKNLLLDHVGVIDICASSRDQYSWFSPVTGGVFTNVLLNAASSNLASAGFVSWNSFVSRVGEQANRDFLAMKSSMLNNPANIAPLTLRQIRAQNAMRPAVFTNTVRASR